MFNNQIITLTWGCQAENHVNMQKVGNGLSKEGFSSQDLINVKHIFEKENYECKIYDLTNEINDFKEYHNIEDAKILVIKKGTNLFTDSNKLFNKLKDLEWDKKYWDNRRQKVLNKLARYNLIFSDFNQKSDFENKRGTVCDIKEIKELNDIKEGLNYYLNVKMCKNLECEGNYYYNIKKCGIGYHGDTERKKVIGMRFGESCDLCYWWYYNYKRINKRISIPLENGDLYIMNYKATGNDWKKKSIFTLRHATGCDKYIK